MKKIFNFKTIILAVGLCIGLLSSCKDQEILGGPDRLFRPIINTTTTSMTWFQLKWDRYKGAKSYELNVSVDSFKTILQDLRTDSTQITVWNLNFDTKYQIRIRSIGDSILTSGDTIKSRFNVLPDITTLDYPTLMTTPTSSDLLDNSVRVQWTKSAAVYTRIDMCVNKDSVYESVNLTSADNLAGLKIVKGLKPSTTYYAKIYQGNAYMGKKIFKTASAQVFVGDVVDLRGFSDTQSLGLLTQTFVDSICAAHPSGLNLVLSGGTSYAIPTINISGTMNIVTGLSFNGKAIIVVNGGFGITASKTVDNLRFEKVFFTQGNTAGKLKTDANYGGTYLFNLNQSGGNINKLIIESCDIKYKRGVVRMQTTATIGSISLNNCLCDSIGGYGIINNANAASRIGDITVSNSTFLHADKLFTCGQTLSVNSITISNITTCFAPLAGGYFLDYNTNVIPGGVSITNSVFGPGSYNTATPPSKDVNGMRFSATTPPNVTVSGCFKTSDLTWAINATTLLPNAPITDFTDLGVPATSIFGDVTKSNYKVIDTRLVKKVGDPRWW